ncbi:DUF7002 family protein [Longitalea luteola]|uniref:DUF7002 family protein n=1 Tax=Longitalea luteola TaxID=2812563 RepID=UPI001A958BD5|nr:hypothetical protein [Longitalea luteola]
MDKQEFIKKTPFLYHLTDSRNLDFIKHQKKLLSTSEIVAISGIAEADDFLKSKRPQHSILVVNGVNVFIRDQRPLNKALEKCLTDNWTPADFIYHLNRRVFMWPNIKRLAIHYGRYESENPIIFRFNTNDILALNGHVEFSKINSGATRPSATLGGKAAPRGKDTFQTFEDYSFNISSVTEVTFPQYCILPQQFEIGSSPNGDWEKSTL